MNKRFIILMVVAGFSSLQASSQKSSLTEALLEYDKIQLRNRSASTESVNIELEWNSPSKGSRNRTESAFAAIENGSVVDAAEISVDLFKDGKMSEQQLISVIRAAQLSPVPGAVTDFAKAYNRTARISSPRYEQFETALRDYDYSPEQRAEVEGMLDAYLNGEKLTVIRLTPWPK